MQQDHHAEVMRIEVLRKAEHGPSRRQHDKLLTQTQELIRSGKEQEARDAIDNTSWRGPQTIWWTGFQRSAPFDCLKNTLTKVVMRVCYNPMLKLESSVEL